MVKHTNKVITKILGVSIISFVIFSNINIVSAEETVFRVNVREVLSVSISTPTSWASGDVDSFLRNKVNVSVTSNNSNGFRASMFTDTNATSSDDTSLINTNDNTVLLNTLSASTSRSNFPANRWGYSLGIDSTLNGNSYNETDAGNENSNYYPMVSTSASPITILSSSNGAQGDVDVYFGAKADLNQASGTYIGTVVISVISGNIDTSTPATPGAADQVANYSGAPVGSTTSGSTTYTYRRTGSGTTTTTTEVSEGDNVSAYEGYTPPQGVTSSTASSNSKLATGLAATAAAAAASGMFFLLLAKRKKDEEEEEEQ